VICLLNLVLKHATFLTQSRSTQFKTSIKN
jgi:hypothetical protein